MNSKLCKKCEITKDKNDFYKHKAVCKLCISNYKKEKCKYCSKFFVDLGKHEKIKHSDEEEFKFLNNISLYTCNECKDVFQLNEFNHYTDKCKKCYNITRKKNKKICMNCHKMFNYYYFKNHKCIS